MRRLARATLASILATSAARAQGTTAPPVALSESAGSTCGAGSRPWIRATGAAPGFLESFRTELATEGFDVCREGGPTSPLATVSVVGSDESSAVEIVDIVTSKRVSRSIDLRSIPADGRDLTLAVAADELLRASWAELAMVDAPPPAAPVPEPVHRAVESSVRPAPAAPVMESGEIGVMLAGETFTGGQTQWGADARARWLVTPRFAVLFRLGLRSTLPKQTPEGEVRGSAVLGGVGAAYAIFHSPHAAIDLFARLDVADVTYVADTTINATASSGSALAVLAGTGGAFGWSVTQSLRLSAELGANAPLRPVRATEGETTVVVGMSGIGLGVGLGAGGLF